MMTNLETVRPTFAPVLLTVAQVRRFTAALEQSQAQCRQSDTLNAHLYATAALAGDDPFTQAFALRLVTLARHHGQPN